LLLLFLAAIGVWYSVFHKTPVAKTVTMQKSSMAPPAVAVPQTSNADRSSGMADKAKDVNPFKNITRPLPSVAPNNRPAAPNAQPVVPLNDFTGG
jgi:hypothetical protein